MKNQSSENKLVITEEFIFDQNKLSKDLNSHFKDWCLSNKMGKATKIGMSHPTYFPSRMRTLKLYCIHVASISGPGITMPS